jgi:cysteine desulfurase
MIYLDHAATTPVRKEVLETMIPWYSISYGNPSSIYELGRKARQGIEEAREKVAAAIGADPREIHFTSGGTESDNWAIRGAVAANRNKGNHIVTSAIEHHAVLHTLKQLEKEGVEVTYIPVDGAGLIHPDRLAEAIRPDTILFTVMMANNEIGTIQPVREIGLIAREKQVLFHTDAVQAAGSLPIDVTYIQADLLSLSAHKFYGPKGVGALYIRRGSAISPLLTGGAQERNRRAGTENVAGIVGMGKAIATAVAEMDAYAGKIRMLRDRTIQRVLNTIPYSRLNGSLEKRLPGNCNFSFDFIEGESLLLLLDMKGIAASSGSACSSGSLDPSHVLMAIGLSHETAHGSLRVSFGWDNEEQDVDTLVENLVRFVARLRDMSPLYEGAPRGNTCGLGGEIHV